MMTHKYIKNVTTLALDMEKCTGCERCTEVCPHAVFILENRKAEITDRDACMECGACALNCPVQALSVSPGVGCAAAILTGFLTGKQPSCDNGEDGCCG